MPQIDDKLMMEPPFGFIHFMAVEIHTRFKAQGIACTQTTRGDTCIGQCLPEGGSLGVGQHDFQTVFTGITGAANKPVASGQALENLQAGNQRCAFFCENDIRHETNNPIGWNCLKLIWEGEAPAEPPECSIVVRLSRIFALPTLSAKPA